MSEKKGLAVATPWDVEGADVLLIHNAGEVLAWPENPGAFGVILNAAGISWTMSSDVAGYDSVNYGVWYDDAQLARVAMLHAQAAKKLKVRKIVIGECGHAHKALLVVADRLLAGDLEIPRESFLTVLRDIVAGGRLRLDPTRNDFPVTLHDPCNTVRLMGIVEPQHVPLNFDQSFWADAVTRLGVAPVPIPYRRLAAESLARAISRCLESAEMPTRAADIARQVRSEQGIEASIEIMHNYMGDGE